MKYKNYIYRTLSLLFILSITIYGAILIQLKLSITYSINPSAPELTQDIDPTMEPTAPNIFTKEIVYINDQKTLTPEIPSEPIKTPTDTIEETPSSVPENLKPENPQNPFLNYLEKIITPTTGTKPPQNQNTPPIIADCQTSSSINTTINLLCHKGQRVYTSDLITIENTEAGSCNVTLEIDNDAPQTIIDNFTTGNLDFYITLSSVDPSALNTLPEPQGINTWTQWENSILQYELINGSLQNITPSQTYTIPASSNRALIFVADCGTDLITGDNGTLNIKTTFNPLPN